MDRDFFYTLLLCSVFAILSFSGSFVFFETVSCLYLCQTELTLEQPNLNKLGDGGGHKGNAKPTHSVYQLL